jgi:hypothetical protein
MAAMVEQHSLCQIFEARLRDQQMAKPCSIALQYLEFFPRVIDGLAIVEKRR